MIIAAFSLLIALVSAPTNDIASVKELYQEGRFFEAKIKLKKVTPTKSNAADVLLYRALLESDAEKSKAYLEKLLSDYPKSENRYQAHLCIAQHHYINESYKDALSSLKHITDDEKATALHSISYLWAARCYEALFDTAKAIACYERIDEESDSTSYDLAMDALKSLRKTKSIFSIQIGSFQNRESAHELAAQYAEKGYETWLATTHKDGSKYYKVLIGEFDSREMAEGFLELFTEKESISHWIVKVRRL